MNLLKIRNGRMQRILNISIILKYNELRVFYKRLESYLVQETRFVGLRYHPYELILSNIIDMFSAPYWFRS